MQVDTVTVQRTRPKMPSMWRVVASGTVESMESHRTASSLIQQIFGHKEADANALVERVKDKGKATLGVFTKEVALHKSSQFGTNAGARSVRIKSDIEEAK